MEAHFHHWIKNKKGNCDFYLTIQTLWYKLAIASYKVRIVRPPKKQDFNFQLQVYISQIWKKSEFRDINLQLRGIVIL